MKALSQGQWTVALSHVTAEDDEGQPWSSDRLAETMEAYFGSHELIRLDPEARNQKHTYIEEESKRWSVDQVFVDPDELNDWTAKFAVDIAASDEEGLPVLQLRGIAPTAEG